MVPSGSTTPLAGLGQAADVVVGRTGDQAAVTRSATISSRPARPSFHRAEPDSPEAQAVVVAEKAAGAAGPTTESLAYKAFVAGLQHALLIHQLGRAVSGVMGSHTVGAAL